MILSQKFARPAKILMNNRTAQTSRKRTQRTQWLIAALLSLVTLVVYWPATSHEFVNYDDNQYVFENTHVTGGLSLQAVGWAFRTGYAANWHPLTWISHMMDCQLYGLKPWGHHLTSVCLHAINAALVFALFSQMTGAMFRSLFVALLFALHPLRVESVAWVAERKDVLSGCFGLLSLIFYVRYAQSGVEGQAVSPSSSAKATADKKSNVQSPKSVRAGNAPSVGSWTIPGTSWSVVSGQWSVVYYLAALLFLALGLMSKPMLVTWPFVMLLLDYWPLRRVRSGTAWRLATEKLPFLALSIAACVITFLVQEQGGAMIAKGKLPFDVRAANALISYCRYLGKLFWPANLAVFYPHPGRWPTLEVGLAAAALCGISALALLKSRKYPFLVTGWLWFVGTLVPVIGLVQVGDLAMADRYTYLPSLGILLMVVWGACELIGRWRLPAVIVRGTGSAATVIYMALTWHQLGYWTDDQTLFEHALNAVPGNYIAHCNLAQDLTKHGRSDEAIRHYREAIRIKPDYADVHNNLGNALSKKGQLDEAVVELSEAIRLNPNSAEAHNNLGSTLLRKGETDQAIVQFQLANRLNSNGAETHFNLGIAFDRKNQIDEAIAQYQQAIQLNPDYAEAHNNLGSALLKKGEQDQALIQYREAIRLNPEIAAAHYNLGAALEGKGQIEEAIAQYQEAARLDPGDADARTSLARVLGKRPVPKP
ncbi:MAG: hypothetical protein C5B50_16345 [Verrucomicrobia bacterium]|nr:MAG: hypothetical protein C5B50_16345 [Verrucomicrobiota bacterium]